MYIPKPPYSSGAKGGPYLFVSGMVPRDQSGNLVGIGDVAAQTTQCMQNVETVLAEAGATLDDVVKCVVFLSDIRYFEAMNEIYAGFFPQDQPARSTIQARLGRPEMLVEVEAIAYLGD